MKQLFICLLVIFSLGFLPGQVLAQELDVPTSSTESGTQETITTRETLDDEIVSLRAVYRTQLEEYRTAERQTQIANGQYAQLGTLTALETAVTSTRKTMLLRATVLESYLTLLRLQLTDATGINLPDKDRVMTRLDAVLSEIATHRQQAESATDRTDITNLTTDFDALSSQIESAAYEAQSMLAIGKLQTVYDKTLALSLEVRDAAGETTELKKAERERAYNEIQNTLAAVKANIDNTTPEPERSGSQFSRSALSNVLRDLGSVYIGLSQSLSFLSELLRL